MIRNLDDAIAQLLNDKAPDDSELDNAVVNFDIPDADWQGKLQNLTVNCYLYDIRQNPTLCTSEPLMQRWYQPNNDGTKTLIAANRRKPPARIDCSYCITAWSPAENEPVADEHRLLSQILSVFLKHPTIPSYILEENGLSNQIPPYPTVIALPDGVKNQPEFWGALDQQLKPSLNYMVTLAIMQDDEPQPQDLARLDVETECLEKKIPVKTQDQEDSP